MQLVIDSGGSIRCLYSEELDLTSLGTLHIARASHVEPTAQGHWRADLEPAGGPILGTFATRSAALAAETEWLERHWLGRS